MSTLETIDLIDDVMSSNDGYNNLDCDSWEQTTDDLCRRNIKNGIIVYLGRLLHQGQLGIGAPSSYDFSSFNIETKDLDAFWREWRPSFDAAGISVAGLLETLATSMFFNEPGNVGPPPLPNDEYYASKLVTWWCSAIVDLYLEHRAQLQQQEESFISRLKKHKSTSVHIHSQLIAREIGKKHATNQLIDVSRGVGALKKWQISTLHLDKIFAAEWLNEDTVFFGTKCNRAFCLEVTKKKLVEIPLPPSRPRNPTGAAAATYTTPWSSSQSHPVVLGETGETRYRVSTGIHAVAVNPQKSLLLCGGSNPNDLAVLNLPTLEPCAVLEGPKDWIFDACWISNELAVGASRDMSVSLWNVEEKGFLGEELRRIEHTDKVRCISYSTEQKQLGTASTDGCFKIWDPNSFDVIKTLVLDQPAVCVSNDSNMFAIGSHAYISFIDARNPNQIALQIPHENTRSIVLRDTLLSIGGKGSLDFFDMRKAVVIQSHACGAGWLKQDEMLGTYFGYDQIESNTIYAQAWNRDTSMLFTGGGPMELGLVGSTAALWV